MAGTVPVATSITTGVRAGAGLTASAQDVRTQNYSFSLITDSYQMWRLKALYRFAVDQAIYRFADQPTALTQLQKPPAKKFVEDYPLIYKSVSQQRNVCLQDKSNNNEVVYGTKRLTDPVSGLPSEFTSCITQIAETGAGSTGMTMVKGTDTKTILVPDEFYLKGPTCVVCYKDGGKTRSPNDKLIGDWLRWRALPGARWPDNYAEGDILLGVYGHYQLFVRQGKADKFADFAIFVLAVSTQSDSAVSGGGSGGSSSAASGGGGGGSKQAPAFAPAPTIPLTNGTGL